MTVYFPPWFNSNCEHNITFRVFLLTLFSEIHSGLAACGCWHLAVRQNRLVESRRKRAHASHHLYR